MRPLREVAHRLLCVVFHDYKTKATLLHNDAKVDGSPHTHYPKKHDKSTTREIKKTDVNYLDRADRELRDGTMRERKDRKDKEG